MSLSDTPRTRDLLGYKPEHGVLICCECKYAIQKSALGSHLLRHKIYRGERRRLLSSIARLKILEPDEVRLPPAGSPPVDGLPIIAGYRCTATGCENLCASSKRMRRHWSEIHGVNDPPASSARSVHLQTFFRGTKLRYFEVASPPPAGDGSQASQSPLSQQQQQPAAPAGPSGLGRPSDPDLETLRYFHHFATTTGLTLPKPNSEGAGLRYWQADVVPRALQQRWLMCGLLAISASHLAALSDTDETTRAHLGQSSRYFQEFFVEWDDIRRDSRAAAVDDARIGAQMICIYRCWQWTLGPSASASGTPFQLRSFARTIQGCGDPTFALALAGGSGDYDMVEDASNHAQGSSSSRSDASSGNRAPAALLERLRALPYRMREAVDKPDSALDFFATIAAIDALVECCAESYASDDGGTTWMAMESWLRRVSSHFAQMAWRRNPAALVVLAHWSMLVARAERRCWFLRGLAARVRRQIASELPDSEGPVHGLIEGLQQVS